MCTLYSMQKRLYIIPLIIEKVNLFLKLIIYESIPKINTFFVFLKLGSIFEPKGYKCTSIIMYVFNSIFGAILYFVRSEFPEIYISEKSPLQNVQNNPIFKCTFSNNVRF